MFYLNTYWHIKFIVLETPLYFVDICKIGMHWLINDINILIPPFTFATLQQIAKTDQKLNRSFSELKSINSSKTQLYKPAIYKLIDMYISIFQRINI